MRLQTAYAIIASGDTLSGVISTIGAKTVGFFVSIPTSCAAYIQASYDVTSANAKRITGVTAGIGSGDFTWAVSSGSKALDISGVAAAFPYLRLETSVAMTAVGSISVITKF